jgi:hypothetical protein
MLDAARPDKYGFRAMERFAAISREDGIGGDGMDLNRPVAIPVAIPHVCQLANQARVA